MLLSVFIVCYKPVFANGGEGFLNEIGFPPIRFIINAKMGLDIIKNDEVTVEKNKRRATDFSPGNTHHEYKTYIIVIGESVRRDYMSLYGFSINNTPYLNSANGVFFDNYVSSSFATVLSLTNSFILRKKGELEFHNNIIRLAKVARFHTYWLSNQGRFGVHDGPVAEIGKGADYTYFIKKGDSNDGEYFSDENLLPEIQLAMKDKRDKLIVIHLIGSHPDACVRTNGKYESKFINEELSCYIQSIKNTDALLNNITSMAGVNGGSWSMLYFSDHGLSHGNTGGGLSHSDQFKENFSPPFVILSSDSKEKIHITALRSGLDFLKIFSQWIKVKDKNLISDCDYFTNEQCTPTAYVVDGNLKMKDFSSLAEDPAKR